MRSDTLGRGAVIKVLVINSGSSSIKYQLFNMDDATVLASGAVERIGEVQGLHSHRLHQGTDIICSFLFIKCFSTYSKITTGL